MKIQCPNIEKGENVHKHSCVCCNGKQHIPVIQALKYELRGLLVLDENGNDASDEEMHSRITTYLNWHRSNHQYTEQFDFERIKYGEPISTLNACIHTLYKI